MSKLFKSKSLFHLEVTEARCVSDLLFKWNSNLKQKFKLVFNWIKIGRKAAYKILQARTSNFKIIKKTQGLYNAHQIYKPYRFLLATAEQKSM